MSFEHTFGSRQDDASLEESYRFALSRILTVRSDRAPWSDDDVLQHGYRVAQLARQLAAMLGLAGREAAATELAALCHDVGKASLRPDLLRNPLALSRDERRELQTHVISGAASFDGSGSDVLQSAQQIILSHHERWDGGGYPAGLRRDAIPLGARVVAVADVFDALTHERPYKSAWSLSDALSEISRQSGRQFDPAVVACLLQPWRDSGTSTDGPNLS